MSTVLVIFVSSIIALTSSRKCDLNNPCEAMICQDARRSCYNNFDVMCECEMFDECEGPWMSQYLPATRPAACSERYYWGPYNPNPVPPVQRPPTNPSPPVNPPPVNPSPPVVRPPVNPPPANPSPPVNPGTPANGGYGGGRPYDPNNACEEYICLFVRSRCCGNFDHGCTCEMFDECEGRFAAGLPSPIPPQFYDCL